MRYTLRNEMITVQIDSHGAELKSLKKNEHEYMWSADPAFWDRTSPVLFPLVGSLKEKQFKSHGRTYEMRQHGFARDMEFALISQDESSLTMRLASSPETLEKWPYEFALDITYTLEGSTVRVSWKVHNTGDEGLYFSIGAHPGFMCPDGHSFVAYVKDADGKELVPAKAEPILVVADAGLLSHEKRTVEFENGRLPITRDLFKYGNGTLVFNDTAIRRVALADEDLKEYVAVDFDMPLVALWSPDIKDTPFVCIEPWCGVCDLVDADGIWEHRAYGNKAEIGTAFSQSYSITVF